jgi:DNA-binding CsgD family transcriptional regulator
VLALEKVVEIRRAEDRVTIVARRIVVEIVGRDQELGFLDAFLDRADGGSTAFVLEGEAGIGKSTLWLAGVEAARERGLRVLESRPTEAERGFAHAGLGDLFEPALDEVLPELAAPRRRALEVALALEDEADDPVDPRTLAVAVRSALEVLAAAGPVLVAIDDVQWLDASTAGAIGFALRRLREENVLVLVARRVGEAMQVPELDKALEAERLRVGPLSLGATQRLVQARLGTTFARPTLLRVHEASGGNPFYALELARALAAHGGGVDPTRPLPVPETLEGLVRARLEGLPDETRQALVLVAALGRATPEFLRAAGVSEDALDPARDARVVEVNGAVRFTHPLLASVLYQGLSAGERRRTHRRLADLVGDPIGRARHLALGAERPDDEIAAALDDAAEQASARGAVVAAAELGEHAVRLTPPAARGDRDRRAIAAAHAHLAAGEVERAKTLAGEIETETAEALLLRAELVTGDLHESIALQRRALQAASGRPELQALIHRKLGLYVRFSEGIAAAEEHARAAIELAERFDDDGLLAGALASLSLIRFNGGKSDAPRLAERAHELAVAAGDTERLIAASFCLAHVHVWSWKLEEARAVLEPLHREWSARDERVAANTAWYLSIVELRAGRWAIAERHAERTKELNSLYARDEEEDPTMYFPVAVAAAHRGDLERARELATYGWRLAERQRALLPGLEATVAVVELWSGNAGEAVERFASAERVATTAGWIDPGICWWRDEYVEALLELGRVDDAVEVLTMLEAEATRLGRTWVLAAAKRCHGLVAANRGDVERAGALLEEAAVQHEALGDAFSRARALLALGIVRRRQRQKRAAREAIEAALAGFEALGAEGWAEKARSELGRISGRRRDEGLTPAERRVAALVAEGRTNREVAAALFLAERTVETHLTQIYGKLGVRSRTELASKYRGSHDFKGSPAS